MKPTIPLQVLQDLPTFAEILTRFHAEQRTGRIIVHFAQGHAQVIEIPAEPERIALDTGAKRRHP